MDDPGPDTGLKQRRVASREATEADAVVTPSDPDLDPSGGDAPAERRRPLLPLPASLRERFERRRDALLKEHPNFLTEPLPEQPALGLAARLDLLVLVVLLLVLSALMYVEYGINVPQLALDWVVRLLDPGLPPRQREA